MTAAHTAVLLEETLALIEPRSSGVYVDATLGAGGHAEALLERSGPDGKLIGLDRDPTAVETVRKRLERFGERVDLAAAKFGDVREVLRERNVEGVQGLVADLGLSSIQLDSEDRGFSFQSTGPIDMRMDTTSGQTALELIASLRAEELADVIYEYGEERKSRAIARSIRRALEAGELHTTADLRAAVLKATGPKRSRIDPATRTFQALRIAVNEELDQLRLLLESLPDVLSEGGRVAIISFHSLEDRMVKRAFRDGEHLRVITKKPITASDDECARNSRSRSAKLRGAELRAAA